MKKLIPLVLVLVVVLAWFVWGQGETYTIHITVPAGTTDEFIYYEVYKTDALGNYSNDSIYCFLFRLG